MDKVKKITKMKLFLPIFSMLLVMMINVIYDIASGNAPFGFFSISINNGILYGRLIDILNRGSEVAILAIGMTLVTAATGGQDIWWSVLYAAGRLRRDECKQLCGAPLGRYACRYCNRMCLRSV